MGFLKPPQPTFQLPQTPAAPPPPPAFGNQQEPKKPEGGNFRPTYPASILGGGLTGQQQQQGKTLLGQ